MDRHGYVAPMTAAKNGTVLDGNARLEKAATKFPGVAPLVVEHDGTRPVIMVRTDIASADDPLARDIIVSANRIAEVDLDYDVDVLRDFAAAGLDLAPYEFDAGMLASITGDVGAGMSEADARATLAERFGVPPFSVLDARQGYWQTRKRAWLALGIESEIGRGADAAPGGGARPACDYAERERGDGHGRPLASKQARIPPRADRDAESGRDALLSAGAAEGLGRKTGLTWGDSAAMRHPTYNHYREQNRARRG
jgi:hypothetical protein